MTRIVHADARRDALGVTLAEAPVPVPRRVRSGLLVALERVRAARPESLEAVDAIVTEEIGQDVDARKLWRHQRARLRGRGLAWWLNALELAVNPSRDTWHRSYPTRAAAERDAVDPLDVDDSGFDTGSSEHEEAIGYPHREPELLLLRRERVRVDQIRWELEQARHGAAKHG